MWVATIKRSQGYICKVWPRKRKDLVTNGGTIWIFYLVNEYNGTWKWETERKGKARCGFRRERSILMRPSIWGLWAFVGDLRSHSCWHAVTLRWPFTVPKVVSLQWLSHCLPTGSSFSRFAFSSAPPSSIYRCNRMPRPSHWWGRLFILTHSPTS